MGECKMKAKIILVLSLLTMISMVCACSNQTVISSSSAALEQNQVIDVSQEPVESVNSESEEYFEEETVYEEFKSVSVEEYRAILQPRLDQITQTHKDIQDTILLTIPINEQIVSADELAAMDNEARTEKISYIFQYMTSDLIDNQELNEYIMSSIKDLNPVIYNVDISFLDVSSNPALSNSTMRYFDYLGGMYSRLIDSFSYYKYDELAVLLRDDRWPTGYYQHNNSSSEKIDLYERQTSQLRSYQAILSNVANLQYETNDLRSPIYILGIWE